MRSLLYKRGVTRLNETAYRCLRLEQEHNGWWPFSYELLADLQANFTSGRDEPLVERLYASMEAGAGVYKITKRGRFDRLDARIQESIEHFDLSTTLQVRDIAVSNGITSVDWFQLLRQRQAIDMEASDYYHRIWLVKEGGWLFTFDEENVPIQMAGYGMVMAIRRDAPWLLLCNRLTQSFARRYVLPRATRRLLNHRQNPEIADPSVRPISLFHPEAERLSRETPAFRLGHRNLFIPLDEPAHLIRAMNILTLRHMDLEKVQQGWKALCSSLLPGGVLVVGRTRDESDGALLVSAYKKTSSPILEKLWEMDGTWECEADCWIPSR